MARWGAVMAVLVLCGVTSCASRGTEQMAVVPAAGDGPSRAEYVEAANARCQAFNDLAEVASAGLTTREDFAAYVTDVIAPEMASMTADLRGLGFPDGDGEYLTTLFDDTDRLMAEVAADPDSLFDAPSDPFLGINLRLDAYGLKVCAE